MITNKIQALTLCFVFQLVTDISIAQMLSEIVLISSEDLCQQWPIKAAKFEQKVQIELFNFSSYQDRSGDRRVFVIATVNRAPGFKGLR